MEEELVFWMECNCGAVFELEKEEVDSSGERWTSCPQCQRKLPVPESV